MTVRIITAALVLILAAAGVADEYRPLILDLDGDERDDTVRIRFEQPGPRAHYKDVLLSVGKAELKIQGVALTGKVIPMDIDRSDRYVELLVPDDGPSDDYATTVVRYRRGELIVLGKVSGKPTGMGRVDLSTDGEGRIRTSARGGILHTWYRDAEFRLEGEELVEQLQPVYAMERHRVTMRLVLPLRTSPTDTTVAGALEPDDEASLLASDDLRWVKIQRVTDDLVGWFEVVAFDSLPAVGLRANEVFKGLINAD